MGMRWLPKYIPWILLLVYWPVLFVLTHLPKLPPTGVTGKDKLAHFAAYLILTLLFWLARYGKLKPAFRSKPFYVALTFMLLYGVADELSQMLVPNRYAEVADWLANASGVAVGLLILMVLRQWWQWLAVYWAGMFVFTHLPTETQPLDFLPISWQQFRLVYLMIAYVGLTLLWWRTWCPQGRFVCNKILFTSTLLVLPTYALMDVMITWAMHKPFDASALGTAVGGVILGIVCSAAFARQHVTMKAESV